MILSRFATRAFALLLVSACGAGQSGSGEDEETQAPEEGSEEANTGESSVEEVSSSGMDLPSDLPGCVVGDLHLQSPEEFVEYEWVCRVEGTLLISGDEMVGSLPELPNLTEVGVLGVESTQLTDLAGLSTLTRSEDVVLIQDNPELHDLSGLDGLARVGGIYILDTPGYLTGGEPLAVGLPWSVTSTVRLEMVDDLTSLSDFRPLAYESSVPNPMVNLRLPSLVDDEGTSGVLAGSTIVRLSMWPFEDLSMVEFSPGTRIVYVEDSDTLRSLDGLESLPVERLSLSRNLVLDDLSAVPTSALEDLRIGDCGVPIPEESTDTDNPSLTSLASLPPLPELEKFYVDGQSGIGDLPLEMTTVTQTVWVSDNPQLDPTTAQAAAQSWGGPDAELVVCGNGAGAELCNGSCEWPWWELAG